MSWPQRRPASRWQATAFAALSILFACEAERAEVDVSIEEESTRRVAHSRRLGVQPMQLVPELVDAGRGLKDFGRDAADVAKDAGEYGEGIRSYLTSPHGLVANDTFSLYGHSAKVYCPRSTGGSCRYFGCDESRGPATCEMHKGKKTCMCQQGFCAFRGRCYAPPDKCAPKPGYACQKRHDCPRLMGPMKCIDGECVCEAGWCAHEGRCYWTRGWAGRCSDECHHHDGRADCVDGHCICKKGYLVERGNRPTCFAWPRNVGEERESRRNAS